ncbi:MAG: HNH endonuclease family protein, partial [Cyanobacteria bacterium J06555_13]
LIRLPKAFRSLRKSNQLLWKAFEYFSDQLETMPSIAESGAGLSSFLTDTIARLFLFIQINVEVEIDAYVLFETLNSRGVELSSTDLLKNYLFSRFKGSTDDLNAARIEWQEITRTVGMEKFPEFLRYFLSMNRRRVRSTQLFKIIKTQVVTAEASFELLNQLNNFSRLYVALGNHNDDFWLDYKPQFKQYVRELNLFRTKQAYPALFAAYERFSERELEKLLKIVTIVSFRYTVVSRLNPNELEAQYNTLAMEISEGKVKTAKAAFNVISSILYIEDSKFEQDFALLAIPTKRKKGLVQYILRQLEKDRTNKDIPEDSFSIEHILPQEPDESWRQNFPETQIEEAIYRVGNMTPLENSLNRKIGRESYDKKRQAYEQSVYSITKDIQAEDWTMDSVVWRQERMAKRAVHIWRVNY